MKKILFVLLAAGCCAGLALAAAPTIQQMGTTPDTSFSGPYTVRMVIKCVDGPVAFQMLGFQYNNQYGDNSHIWPYDGSPTDSWIEEYTQSGDTFTFAIPAVPNGVETPTEVGYCVYACNGNTWEETYFPASSYNRFMCTALVPQFGTTAVADTFYNGPFSVHLAITPSSGSSIISDSLFYDFGSGAAGVARDSVGAGGDYCYTLPRFPGNEQTPVTVNWWLKATDSVTGDWTYWPPLRDTLLHFMIIDPWSVNTRALAATDQLGPFPVWTTFKSEGTVINDSLMILDVGAGTYTGYGRDSTGTADPRIHYYTIPAQDLPVVRPDSVMWYIRASDSVTGNYTNTPSTAPAVPFKFRIYDWTPPVISNLPLIANTDSLNPVRITATCRDTSGISQVRLYYRAKPNADTSWSYLPMFATGVPDQYAASIPVQYPGTLVQYYVSAKDGALYANGSPLWNERIYPGNGLGTPYQYYVGPPAHRLLLVNDELPSNSYEAAYQASLDTTGVLFGYWDNRAADVLPLLGNFNTLIWFTGEDSVATLGQADRDSLAAFLDRGGNMLLCSKNLGQNIGDTSVFYHDYLKAQFYSNRSTQSFAVGRNAYPISNGAVDTLLVSGSAELTRSIDVIVPLPGADSVFTFRTIGRCGVVRCSTAVFKTVYSSIPVEGMTRNTAGRISRTYFLARCLKYFGMDVFYKVEGDPALIAGAPVLSLSPASPNPFRHSTRIDYQMPRSERVGLRVYNVAGQLVKTLVDRTVAAGRYSVSWDGTDESGRHATNGIYLYRLEAGRQKMIGKVVIIR